MRHHGLIRLSALALSPLLVMSLGGCVYSSQVKDRPLEPPEQFAAAGQGTKAPPPGKFWQLFGDPLLDKLVDQALQKNLGLDQARAAVSAAQASIRGARAGWYPRVSAGVSAGYSQRAFRVPQSFGGGGITTTRGESYDLSVQASYEVDLWGKVRFAHKAAKASLAAAEGDLSAARISVVAQLVDAYFLAVQLRAQIALTDQTIQARQDHLEVVKRRYREGVVTALDLYQAEESLARVKAGRPTLSANLAAAEHAIAVLVGDFPRQKVAGELAELPRQVKAPPAGVPAQLLLRRPDIRAAHARLVAADAQVGQAVAQHYPSLSISGSVGTPIDPFELIYSILGSLTAPLFNGFAIAAEVDRREALLAQSLASYKTTLLTAVREVEDALVRGQKMAERVALLGQRVEAAEATLRMSTEQYLQGLTPYLTVLTAEQSVFSARSELISARRELISARVQLARALAGDWTKDREGSHAG